MRTLRAASFVIALVAASVPCDAGEKSIEIGEVSSNVAREGVDYASLLRRASEDELRALDLSRVPRGKKVIVSVALVRMDTLDEPRRSATCVVNATLRDARRGAVFAILEGKAEAIAEGERLTLERSAMHGALHGALGRIPEALRR